MLRLRPEAPKEPLRVGDRLSDRYYVVERLAAGGHSIVYRGDDERLSRPVCIKVFHRLGSSGKDGVYQTAYEHFVQEAFALSKLTHPNTLRIYDFGYLVGQDPSEKGPPFQVSEYMDHGTLASLIKRHGPMPVADAKRVVSAIGGALSEAHQCSIIHRDIKPQNILFHTVGRGWVAKLADFGIAKALQAENERLMHQAEDTAVVAGRPLLMYSLRWAAPEQLAGKPALLSSDVYSLALSIIFMLTGNSVFASKGTMSPYEQRRRSDELIDVAFAASDVPKEATDLLKRACAMDPQARPKDADEFTEGLVAAMDGARPSAAPPQLTAVPSYEPSRPHPMPPKSMPPRRMHVSQAPQPVADRRAYFLVAPGGRVDVTCCNGAARLRLSFVPTSQGMCLHVKGLNCFVARSQGRPSSAVQFEHDGRCDLVAPNRGQLANMAVLMGTPAAGHRVFVIGNEAIAISTDECPQVACLDFGSGNDCLFIHVPRSSRG